MKIKQRAVQPARIEMLPLIDIVFLLLVVFIYAMLSMAVHRGIQLDLPVSERAVNVKNGLTLTVVHQGAGATASPVYTLNGEPVSLSELDKALARAGEELKSPPILLFADKQISYQQLFEVLDLLKKNNCTSVSLQAAGQ